jgi:hypothetical protein
MDMETLKVFQDSINEENAEVIASYNKAKSSKLNNEDKIDAEVVEDFNDAAPEKILST